MVFDKSEIIKKTYRIKIFRSGYAGNAGETYSDGGLLSCRLASEAKMRSTDNAIAQHSTYDILGIAQSNDRLLRTQWPRQRVTVGITVFTHWTGF